MNAGSKAKMARLTWRKQPNEQRSARVAQGPRGAHLFVDGERVATIQAVRSHGRHVGWMWYARCDAREIPLKNTALDGREPYPLDDAGLAAAKADCEAYVREVLAAAAAQGDKG